MVSPLNLKINHGVKCNLEEADHAVVLNINVFITLNEVTKCHPILITLCNKAKRGISQHVTRSDVASVGPDFERRVAFFGTCAARKFQIYYSVIQQ